MAEQRKKKRGKPKRSRAALGAGIAATAIIVTAVLFMWNGSSQPTKKVPEIRLVTLQPVPPPPPPPPPVQLPPPKMVEQTPMKEPEIKQEKIENKPKEPPPPASLGLDAKGEGPGDGFNLAGRPGGNGLLGGGGGSRWGWYASLVQTQIEQALRENQKTRNAKLRIEVRLWSDANGSIGRVQLMTSTGDSAIDQVIKNEVLTGLKLREPPPKDMPMPIVARLTERQAG
jgi:protein TonB